MHLREAPDVTRAGLHSRSILAGYDPQRLADARVCVVGLGALGQNLVQNLALCGVGHLTLVDFDEFERHNATRSPFFPTSRESALLGPGKADVVGSRLLGCATADPPDIRLAPSLVQLAGDGVIRWADVVVSAVDSVNARAWLAERSRVHGRPLVEGGFSGPDLNFSAFAPGSGQPCYRCFNPGRRSSASCRQYAQEAEAAAIVPAIQTGAAVLGGLMAEAVIQVLHGRADYGLRTYGNVRSGHFQTSQLAVHPECPGRHHVLPVLGEVAAPATLGELAAVIRHARTAGRIEPSGWIELAEPALITEACTGCLRLCRVQSSESAWLAQPRCTGCGGRWPLGGGAVPQSVVLVPLEDPLPELVAGTPTEQLGLRPGGAVTVLPPDEGPGLFLLSGPADTAWAPARPMPGGR